MNEYFKERALLILMLIGVVMIILVGIFVIQYYFKIDKDECTSNPLVYGAKQLEEQNGVKVIGSVSFMNHPEVRISFDSENVSIEKDTILLPLF